MSENIEYKQNVVSVNEKGDLQVQINLDELRKRKLFIATPMYGGICNGIFTRSLLDIASTCKQNGIEIMFHSIFNESLIPRARAYCADEFLRSKADNLLFIDSDIGFSSQDVLTLMALQTEDSPYDVICGPYPKKTISWEKIKIAVDKGVADKNPQDLEKYVGDYVFNPAPGISQIKIAEPCEVLESGTGFMMIRRKAFELFDKHYPEMSYKPDHVRTANFDGSREIMMYFHCEIDPVSKRYLSEDYWFCQKIRNAGGKVWLCPWMSLQHAGSYTFGGSLAALASIGANPTADSSQLKKEKK